MVTISYVAAYTFFFLALVAFLFMKKHKRKPQENLKLPPGSMGWPYIGETLQLYSKDPNIFFASKQKSALCMFTILKVREIFKTHLLGCPCVMLASPEAARFVLWRLPPPPPEARPGLAWPDDLRGLIPDVEAIVIAMLDAWNGRVLSTFHAMKKFSFDVAILTFFGDRLSERHKVELKKNYFIVDKAYNSFPTNFPGTPYYKAIQARKQLSRILSEIMNERRETGVVGNDDLLGVSWTQRMKRGEQMAFLEANKSCGNRPLTWAQTRSMTLTHRVIMESLRMASIISFTFREAVADVEYKVVSTPFHQSERGLNPEPSRRGLLLRIPHPKGWKVMPLFRNIHHNPEFFPNPHEFEPSRFKVAPKPNTYMPFGNGNHACPGNELAKLEMLVLIHNLVTKYRWEIVGTCSEIEYSPFPVPKHGLPVKLWRLSTNAENN
uniref:Abscisic acid 8'-hydroxylase 3 n=1 Tax=Ananas comosus var. bracteatus TaxID=296719 RepID=A0A6V7P8W8_ANACO|nr:unnamed protein product [Ananas comosus var. bracteatus]